VYVRRKFQHIPGPKTNGFLGFYLGNVREIVQVIRRNQILPDLLTEWHDKYGPIFKFQMFNLIFVFTSDRDAIKEILIIKNYPKTQFLMSRVMFPFNERYLGFGLVTDPDNESWRRRRSFFNPGFHRKYLFIIFSKLRL